MNTPEAVTPTVATPFSSVVAAQAPVIPAVDPQAALLALLTQAAATSSITTPA